MSTEGGIMNIMKKWGQSLSSRCYLRGTSRLGRFNTVLGCFINRVLIRVTDNKTGETVRWRWGKATDFPPHDSGVRASRQKQGG